MLDYDTLRVIWWLLLGVLLIGFAVMDGFDLGVAVLLPLVGRSDLERRVVFNTIGPVWEGNQVWLILGGGAIFAAWPPLYALSFSGFYIAMFLVLAALILRPVSIVFRSKIEAPRWRAVWDVCFFISGIVPALVFGVAVGNALLGVAFSYDADLRPSYDISLWSLLNPFGLLCGLVSLAMMTMHGAAYLALKSEGAVSARARRAGQWAALATILLFAVAGFVTATMVEGYRITSAVAANAPSNPLAKTVARETGAWLANYGQHPWMLLAPILGVLGALLAILLLRAGRGLTAFVATAISVFGIVSTAGVSMFPFLLPSSTEPNASLTVWDASSSEFTLGLMLVAALIFVPIILAYTAWVFRVMRGAVTTEAIARDSHGNY